MPHMSPFRSTEVKETRDLAALIDGGKARHLGIFAPSCYPQKRAISVGSRWHEMARSLLRRPSMRAGNNCLVYIPVGLALASCLFACSVDGDGGGDGVTRIPGDPAFDQGLDADGIICQTSLILSGAFTESAPQPADISGCWGVGTWRVTGTTEQIGCSPQADMPEFVYEAIRDEEGDTTIATFPADADNERLNLGISSNAEGCIGLFEHFGDDFAVWTFEVYLRDGGVLEGKGTYAVHKNDPF